jgi:hypothetical protein
VGLLNKEGNTDKTLASTDQILQVCTAGKKKANASITKMTKEEVGASMVIQARKVAEKVEIQAKKSTEEV